MPDLILPFLAERCTRDRINNRENYMRFCRNCSQRLADSVTVCPVCGHDASDAVDEQVNKYDPEKYSHGAMARVSYKKPRATYALIAANVIVWLFITAAAYKGIDISSLLSMHRGAVAGGEWYRLITSMFTHEEFFHLASNCYALLIYGMILEPAIGKGRFLAVYFTGGLLGNALSFALMSNPSIGASGAVFGLLGAVIAIHFINPTAMSRAMTVNAVISVGLTTFYSIGGNINNLAHFGGLFGGYMMMCLTTRYRMRKRTVTNRALLSVLLVLAFAVSAFFGVTVKKSVTETCYGSYTKMCFFASVNEFEKAEKEAEKIISSGENVYSADALAARVLYLDSVGKSDEATECFNELIKINSRVPMMNETIYNKLSGK